MSCDGRASRWSTDTGWTFHKVMGRRAKRRPMRKCGCWPESVWLAIDKLQSAHFVHCECKRPCHLLQSIKLDSSSSFFHILSSSGPTPQAEVSKVDHGLAQVELRSTYRYNQLLHRVLSCFSWILSVVLSLPSLRYCICIADSLTTQLNCIWTPTLYIFCLHMSNSTSTQS